MLPMQVNASLPRGVDRSKVDYAALIRNGGHGPAAGSPAVDSPCSPRPQTPQLQGGEDEDAALQPRAEAELGRCEEAEREQKVLKLALAFDEARVQAAVHQKRRARRQLAQLPTATEQPLEPAPESEPEPEPEPEPEQPVYAWNPEELAQQAAVFKHLLEEKMSQDLQAAQQTMHMDPSAEGSAAPSAAWSTRSDERGEMVLTFLTQGRLGFDLAMSGDVSCIANDAIAPVSTDLRVGMVLSAVQGRAIAELSCDEKSTLWSSTIRRRPLALTFALPPRVSRASPESQEHLVEHSAAADRPSGAALQKTRERSPTVATQQMVQATVESLRRLEESLQSDAEPGGGSGGGSATLQEDGSVVDRSTLRSTVKSSAEVLRAAASEIEQLKRELRMFQQGAPAEDEI